MKVTEVPREVPSGPFRQWLDDLRTLLAKSDANPGVLPRIPYAFLAERKPRLDTCIVAICPDHPQGSCLVASTVDGWQRLTFSGPA